jgi:hypothetical protein
MADPTLWQAPLLSCARSGRLNRGRHDRRNGDRRDKFSSKSSDWADVKTEIVSAIETACYSYITKMGAHLFSVAGSGDHGHIEDGDLEKHFKKQMWPTLLRSIRSQVTKSTLDAKCEEYQKLTDDEKTEIRDWKVINRMVNEIVEILKKHEYESKMSDDEDDEDDNDNYGDYGFDDLDDLDDIDLSSLGF